MNEKVRILKLDLKSEDFVILSDVHGDLFNFQKILKDERFLNRKLIILGDLIEKGKDSLKLLELVMTLKERVILILGNNDVILNEILDDVYSEEELAYYLKKSRNSILKDLVNKDVFNLLELKEAILRRDDILSYLNTCPHIIETSDLIMVHSGIDPYKSLENQDISYLLESGHKFIGQYKGEKLLIVGHWPVSAYHDIPCVNPYLHKNHVLSIDGGNMTKTFGQINVVDLSSGLKVYRYDALEAYRCLEDQSSIQEFNYLAFPKTEIKLLDHDEALILYRGQKIKVQKGDYYTWRSRYFLYDQNDYLLDVKSGDIIYKVHDNLFKKDGIVGRYLKKSTLIA